jgi:hypothetical protein
MYTFKRPREATNNVLEQCHNSRVRNPLGEQLQENALVYASEELPNVALQYPAGLRVVLTNLISKCLKSSHCAVRPLPQLAGVGIGNERAAEERVHDAVDGVVHQPVANRSFVNVPWLGVGYTEVLVGTVAVRALCQLTLQRQNIVNQPVAKSLHVGLIAFAWQKFPPGREQILNGNDILQGVTQQDAPIPRVYPPPDCFRSSSG